MNTDYSFKPILRETNHVPAKKTEVDTRLDALFVKAAHIPDIPTLKKLVEFETKQLANIPAHHPKVVKSKGKDKTKVVRFADKVTSAVIGQDKKIKRKEIALDAPYTERKGSAPVAKLKTEVMVKEAIDRTAETLKPPVSYSRIEANVKEELKNYIETHGFRNTKNLMAEVMAEVTKQMKLYPHAIERTNELEAAWEKEHPNQPFDWQKNFDTERKDLLNFYKENPDFFENS